MRRRQPQFGTTMADLEPGPPADDAKRHCKATWNGRVAEKKEDRGLRGKLRQHCSNPVFQTAQGRESPARRGVACSLARKWVFWTRLLCSFATSKHDCAYRGIRAGTGGGLFHAQGTSNAHPRDQGTEDVRCKEVEHAQTRCTVDDGWLLAGLALWGADGAEAS